MENQHRLIKGYRDLSEQEITLMNQVKAEGERLRALIEELQSLGTIDQEWVLDGKRNLQVGIMFLVRAIARPTSF